MGLSVLGEYKSLMILELYLHPNLHHETLALTLSAASYGMPVGCFINKTTPKVRWFAGFCHHCLMTTSVHTHAYRYLLFESGMKAGLFL